MARKNFSADFKAKVALEAIKGHLTVNEITAEYGVHPSQINSWKKQLLEASSDIFSRKKQRQNQDLQTEKDQLYQQIGQLQVEVNWFKKKLGH